MASVRHFTPQFSQHAPGLVTGYSETGKPTLIQQELRFDRPPAQSHSATSREAADSIEPGVGERRLLDWLKANGPATDLEMQDALGWRGDYQRPRRVRLVQLGQVVDSGTTRATAGGRKASVWRVR